MYPFDRVVLIFNPNGTRNASGTLSEGDGRPDDGQFEVITHQVMRTVF